MASARAMIHQGRVHGRAARDIPVITPAGSVGSVGMTAEADIAARVERLLAAPIAATGCRLLEVQYRNEGGWVLRLIVDRIAEVGLDDLSAVSELAARLLDVEDPIPQAYSLEVSSPGIFRPLKAETHFRQSIGKVARVALAAGCLEQRKSRIVRGVITGVKDEVVYLSVGEEELKVPLEGIGSARLDPDL